MLRIYASALALATALLAPTVLAQTSTDCDPTKVSCPADPALGISWGTTFNSSMSTLDDNLWNITAGQSLMSFTSDGLTMALAKKGDSVAFKTRFYLMFGTFEVIFKPAPGQGIISSAILLSDDLDEIDWEIKGNNNTHVATNWYGKGDRAQSNGGDFPLANAQNGFHSYKVDWNKDRLQFALDGNVLRTVDAGSPGNYPQTPAYLSLSLWSAGDSTDEGTVTWAGGKTDWSKGPFTMTVKSISVTDGGKNTTEYTYGDKTGSYQSIKSATGQSKAAAEINKPSTAQSVSKTINNLSTGAKIGIAAGIGGTAAILFAVFCVYCMMQRKRGRAERAAADKEWQAHEAELLQYRQKMNRDGFARINDGHGRF